MKATVDVADGKVKVSFKPEDLEKSRWAPYGQELHMRNIGLGHKKAAEGAETIKKVYNESYKDKIAESRLAFPEIK